MVSDRVIKLVHAPLLGLTALMGLVTLAMSASLVDHYNKTRYPNISYRDRIRLILAGAIWSLLTTLILLIGVIVKPDNIIVGIFSHLIALSVGFIILIIGAAALTALTNHLSCSGLDDFSRCSVVKGLVGVTWTTVVLTFIALAFVFAIGVKARSGAGMRKSSLVDA